MSSLNKLSIQQIISAGAYLTTNREQVEGRGASEVAAMVSTALGFTVTDANAKSLAEGAGIKLKTRKARNNGSAASHEQLAAVEMKIEAMSHEISRLENLVSRIIEKQPFVLEHGGQ